MPRTNLKKVMAEQKLVARAHVSGDPVHAAAIAEMALQPNMNVEGVIEGYGNWMGKPEVGALADALDAWDGDMGDAEGMLYAHAHALQSIFANLARKSLMVTHLNQAETFMRLALKAQNQARMTLATLSEMKNPRPIAFVKQANIAHGPQQINNGAEVPGTYARAEQNESAPNQLLEASDGERLDFGAQGTPSATHPDLEALVEVDRSAYGPRQAISAKERLEGRRAPDGSPSIQASQAAARATPKH